MNSQEWRSGTILTPRQDNGFYVEKSALNAAFTSDGRHLHPVPFRIIGNTMTFIQVMAAYSLHARVINSALDHHTVVLEPVEYSYSH